MGDNSCLGKSFATLEVVGPTADMSSNLKNGVNSTSFPWVNLFKEIRGISNGLKLEKKEVGEVVELTKDHVLDTLDAWGICLIGFILGRFPGLKAIQEVCESWKVPSKYFIHYSGWLVFKFDKDEDRNMVLDKGPYESFGRPWVLKKLPSYFRFDEDRLSKVPIWVKLPSFPLELWSCEGLSMIASRVGEPIMTDKFTAERTHPSYARILVEVDASLPLVRSVSYRLPNGELKEQEIIYEYEPTFCTKCHRMGHAMDKCDVEEQQKKKKCGRSRSRKWKACNVGVTKGMEVLVVSEQDKQPCTEVHQPEEELHMAEVNDTTEMAVLDEEQVEESLSTLPSDDDGLILAKLFEPVSHNKIERKVKSQGEVLKCFFEDMVSDEEEGCSKQAARRKSKKRRR